MLPASPRRQGVSSVHPQRYEGFDPKSAQGIIIYYTPEAIYHKCIVRTQLFLTDNDPGTPQETVVCSSSTSHLMAHGPGRPVKTRGRPYWHGGRRRSSSSSTPHLMGSGPGRPVKTYRPPHGPGGAAHIEPTSHGPRPGPVHQISRGWAAARPGPSNFQSMGCGPARPIKMSEDGPRPDPAHHIFKSSWPGPARPIRFSNVSARPGPAQTNGPWQALQIMAIFYY